MGVTHTFFSLWSAPFGASVAGILVEPVWIQPGLYETTRIPRLLQVCKKMFDFHLELARELQVEKGVQIQGRLGASPEARREQ
jgi:hypothetical protein